MRLRLLALIVAGCVVAGIPGLASATYGPGPHWIDTTPGGMDVYLSSTAAVELDLNLDGGPDATYDLIGPTTIARSGPLDDSMVYPGLKPLDGHFDVIDTEIVSMSLTGGGVTLIAGAGLGQGGVLQSSLGAIAEQATDNTLGDSFYDIWLELDLGGGNYAYNQTPIRIRSVVDRVPVIATYDSGPVLVTLYDSPVPGQGNRVANLTHLELTVPEPAVLTLLALGGLALLARRRT